MRTEWDITVTTAMDTQLSRAADANKEMHAYAAINALLSLIRNPAIKTTEGKNLRDTLKTVMDSFDDEESMPPNCCPTTLWDAAAQIVTGGASKRKKAEPTEAETLADPKPAKTSRGSKR